MSSSAPRPSKRRERERERGIFSGLGSLKEHNNKAEEIFKQNVSETKREIESSGRGKRNHVVATKGGNSGEGKEREKRGKRGEAEEEALRGWQGAGVETPPKPARAG